MRKAENFILKDQYGNDFELYRNLGSGVVLVFYPRNDSMVCSKQLKDYSDNLPAVNEAGINILSINNASERDHLQFCENKGLKMTLLSDPDSRVIKEYGALYPFNIIKRKLIFINKNGDIVFEKVLSPISYWDSEKILDFIRENEFF